MKKVTALILAVGLVFAPTAAYAKPGNGQGEGHTPVTFCHKPGTPAEKELTTDDDGFLQGHLDHGDILGACPIPEGPTPTPTPEPTPTPTPTVEPTPEPTPTETPTPTPTPEPTVEPTPTPEPTVTPTPEPTNPPTIGTPEFPVEEPPVQVPAPKQERVVPTLAETGPNWVSLAALGVLGAVMFGAGIHANVQSRKQKGAHNAG
jgi:outer membrane biosynthesis protein TonB